MINIVLKGFWYSTLYSDWYPMPLFESSLSSAFWNVLSYSVIRAYSVSDFEKCTTLFPYFSLLCYLELWSSWSSTDRAGGWGELSGVNIRIHMYMVSGKNSQSLKSRKYISINYFMPDQFWILTDRVSRGCTTSCCHGSPSYLLTDP